MAETLGEDLDDLLDEIAEDEERLGELGLETRPENPIANKDLEDEKEE